MTGCNKLLHLAVKNIWHKTYWQYDNNEKTCAKCCQEFTLECKVENIPFLYEIKSTNSFFINTEIFISQITIQTKNLSKQLAAISSNTQGK